MCAWPIPSAGHGRSGVSASQMWTCESMIMRRAGCALAGSHAGDASAAPAATVVVRTSRRDNMGGLLLRGFFRSTLQRILLVLNHIRLSWPGLSWSSGALDHHDPAGAPLRTNAGPVVLGCVRTVEEARRQPSPTPSGAGEGKGAASYRRLTKFKSQMDRRDSQPSPNL